MRELSLCSFFKVGRKYDVTRIFCDSCLRSLSSTTLGAPITISVEEH